MVARCPHSQDEAILDLQVSRVSSIPMQNYWPTKHSHRFDKCMMYLSLLASRKNGKIRDSTCERVAMKKKKEKKKKDQ